MWPPEAASPSGENRLAAGAAKPSRAKGSLNRRSKWFSLVTFFLQKKKVTRAGARNSPSRARRRMSKASHREAFAWFYSSISQSGSTFLQAFSTAFMVAFWSAPSAKFHDHLLRHKVHHGGGHALSLLWAASSVGLAQLAQSTSMLYVFFIVMTPFAALKVLSTCLIVLGIV